MVPNEETLLIHLRQEITRVVLFFRCSGNIIYQPDFREISARSLKEFARAQEFPAGVLLFVEGVYFYLCVLWGDVVTVGMCLCSVSSLHNV